MFRGVDPYWTGGHAPNIYEGGRPWQCPPNILELMSFCLGLFYPLTATTVVCCILMHILCLVSQKASPYGGLRPPASLPGLRPWTLLGGPPVFFYVPQ